MLPRGTARSCNAGRRRHGLAAWPAPRNRLRPLLCQSDRNLPGHREHEPQRHRYRDGGHHRRTYRTDRRARRQQPGLLPSARSVPARAAAVIGCASPRVAMGGHPPIAPTWWIITSREPMKRARCRGLCSFLDHWLNSSRILGTISPGCLMRAVMNKADRSDLEVRLCTEHQPHAAEASEVQASIHAKSSTSPVDVVAMPREPPASDLEAEHPLCAGSRAERPSFAAGSEARSVPTHGRLAAVLVADVAGYSRLMGAYEERTSTGSARSARRSSIRRSRPIIAASSKPRATGC